MGFRDFRPRPTAVGHGLRLAGFSAESDRCRPLTTPGKKRSRPRIFGRNQDVSANMTLSTKKVTAAGGRFSAKVSKRFSEILWSGIWSGISSSPTFYTPLLILNLTAKTGKSYPESVRWCPSLNPTPPMQTLLWQPSKYLRRTPVTCGLWPNRTQIRNLLLSFLAVTTARVEGIYAMKLSSVC